MKEILDQSKMKKNLEEYSTYKKFIENPQEIKDLKLHTNSIAIIVPCTPKVKEIIDQDNGKRYMYLGDEVIKEQEKVAFNTPLIVVAVGDQNRADRIINPLDRVIPHKNLQYQRNFYYDNIMIGIIDIMDVAVSIPTESLNKISMEYISKEEVKTTNS